MMKAFKIINHGINTLLCWDENRIELRNNKKPINRDELLLLLVHSGFFGDDMVMKAYQKKRKYPYSCEEYNGRSGCIEYSLYSLPTYTLLGKYEFRDKLLKSRIHFSWVDDLNQGIDMPLMDFVSIVCECMGYALFFNHPTWIENTIEDYLAEQAVIGWFKHQFVELDNLSEEQLDAVHKLKFNKRREWLQYTVIPVESAPHTDEILTGTSFNLNKDDLSDEDLENILIYSVAINKQWKERNDNPFSDDSSEKKILFKKRPDRAEKFEDCEEA